MTPLHEIEAMLAKCTPGDDVEWPVYAVKTKDGELYYLDLAQGNRYNSGDGWLVVCPWGEERKAAFYSGDNRCLIEHENVDSLTLLTDARAPSLLRELVDRLRKAEKVVEAAKALDALWGDAQVNIGPTELRVHKALAEYRALTDEHKEK